MDAGIQPYAVPAHAVCVLPPALFPPVAYFDTLAAAGTAVVDCYRRYNKRDKYLHRFSIASPHGALALTVPVTHPRGESSDSPLSWSDILVSDHNRWWTSVPQTFETAYARTPYFEALWPEIAPLLDEAVVGRPVIELVANANALIRRLMHITTPVSAAMVRSDDSALRPAMSALSVSAPYPQTGMDAFGFVPGLSVLDYIFNAGLRLPSQIHG